MTAAPFSDPLGFIPSMSTTTETRTDERIDPEDNPLDALKELAAREIDGAVPVMCTKIEEGCKSIQLYFETKHRKTFTREVDVPDTIEGSGAEQLIRDDLGWEIQNIGMLEGEWFYAKNKDGGWSFYDPPSNWGEQAVQKWRDIDLAEQYPSLDTTFYICGGLLLLPLVSVYLILYEGSEDRNEDMFPAIFWGTVLSTVWVVAVLWLFF